MNLWEWLKGKAGADDLEAYVEAVSPDLPATPQQQYLLIACLHFSASVLLPILFFSIGGRETETSVAGAKAIIEGGGWQAPAEVGLVLFHVIQALQWPMSWFLEFLSQLAGAPMFAGLVGYLATATNSLICAIPIFYAYRWIVKVLKRPDR